MNEHPIQGLINTAMENIKDMIDVNTIIGEPVEAPNGTLIIPISKVSFGFVSGGSEFDKSCNCSQDTCTCNSSDDEKCNCKLPFGGGSGAGVSINPTGFLIITNNEIKILPAYFDTSLDRILDFIPTMTDKLIKSLQNNNNNCK